MIEKIFTRGKTGAAFTEHQTVQVIASSGIDGDRYFNCDDEPGQNLTLVEAEAIEDFLKVNQRAHDLSITGRNLVTRGVSLNDLLGQEFTIGQVRLRGVDLCNPCSKLGKALAGPELSAAAVVKQFVKRGGLRADVLSSGKISVGDRVQTDHVVHSGN